MRRTTPKNRVLHKKRRIVLAVLLLCIACLVFMELLVCRFADHALYIQVTAPARACARVVVNTGSAAASAVYRAGLAAGEQIAAAGQTVYAGVSEKAEAASEAIQKKLAPEVRIPEKSSSGRGLADSQLAGPSVLPAPQGMVDESISHLEGRGSLEYLTGGGIEVVYYNQTDAGWSSTMYGSDPLSGYGCGPTAMAMVVSTLLQQPVDPAEMAKECVNRGYWCKRSGSYLSIVEGIAEAYGLQCQSIPPEQLETENLMLHLATGDLVVALMTRGHFTNSGHFIVLRGLTLEGDILVADPASRERSLTPWELSLLISELSPSRHNGAPLWLLSLSPGIE